nr:hypothetical protein [Tanacetum cinerariifolium]
LESYQVAHRDAATQVDGARRAIECQVREGYQVIAVGRNYVRYVVARKGYGSCVGLEGSRRGDAIRDGEVAAYVEVAPLHARQHQLAAPDQVNIFPHVECPVCLVHVQNAVAHHADV